MMKTRASVGLRLAMLLAVAALAGIPVQAGSLSVISRDPYIGAIAIDAATGKVLFEENADVPGYPASVIKLMDLLIILEKIQAGKVSLTDKVTVTAQVSRIGGSQVYLKENEVFTVEELIYAMIVKSANDAAVALALHVAGSTDAFVQLMNRRARELGMNDTVFSSVHGLPPDRSTDQQPDVSSARDLALLARELVTKRPETIQYTSTRIRPFRLPPNQMIMRTHNRLLGVVEGVDGLKTGYFETAGFSTAVSARRNNRRVIVVVLGCKDRLVREKKTSEMVARAFLALPPLPPREDPSKRSLAASSTNNVAADEDTVLKQRTAHRGRWPKIGIGVGVIAVVILVVVNVVLTGRRNRNLR